MNCLKSSHKISARVALRYYKDTFKPEFALTRFRADFGHPSMTDPFRVATIADATGTTADQVCRFADSILIKNLKKGN